MLHSISIDNDHNLHTITIELTSKRKTTKHIAVYNNMILHGIGKERLHTPIGNSDIKQTDKQTNKEHKTSILLFSTS